jgi:putative hydrolase of the HAD superfamily
MLEFTQSLANTGRFLMGTINNESRELNYYRMQKFGLRNTFCLFFSSCFVGLRKPERDIYRLALETTQIPAEECGFVDDRSINVEAAAQMGIHVIQMRTLDQLRSDLLKLGVSP